MDEFAVQKGHCCATVVVEPERKQVLWVGGGRSAPKCGRSSNCWGLTAASACAPWRYRYDLEVKQHCPNAGVFYDLFHVVAKYGRQVTDRVRVEEANRPDGHKPARRVVKTSRWLLLRNRENVLPEQAVKLDELLAGNRALLTAYVLE